MMSYKIPLFLTLPILAAGCAAAPLQAPAAANVLVTRNAPAPDCKFVGEVLGSQGNFWTAEFTSDEDLIRGARNRMRDLAFNLGANFVQLELESQSHNTADASLGGVYSSVVVGNAYICPNLT
jgi:hypothetical protein